MITQKQLKYYSSLLQKKYRNKEKKFLVEGKKLVTEAINSAYKTEVVFITNLFTESNPDFVTYLDQLKLPVEIIKDKEIEKLCDTVTPQGVAAVLPYPDTTINLKSKVIIGLDNISDPGNLGTILRNCDWFGFADIILSKNSAELFSPKVIRASMGSVFHLNFSYGEEPANWINSYKKSGYKIISSDLQGKDIYNFQFSEKYIIIFSNEASGPSLNVKKNADEVITIPGKGRIESLNVASASAVILSEIMRTQS